MTDLVAQIASGVILALGVSYVLQARQWVRLSREIIELPHRFLTGALVMVVLGLTVVAAHNDWELAWTLPVTLLGWVVLVKGVVFLLFPHVARSFSGWSERALLTWVRAGGVVLAVVGAILTQRAWIAR